MALAGLPWGSGTAQADIGDTYYYCWFFSYSLFPSCINPGVYANLQLDHSGDILHNHVPRERLDNPNQCRLSRRFGGKLILDIESNFDQTVS